MPWTERRRGFANEVENSGLGVGPGCPNILLSARPEVDPLNYNSEQLHAGVQQWLPLLHLWRLPLKNFYRLRPHS